CRRVVDTGDQVGLALGVKDLRRCGCTQRVDGGAGHRTADQIEEIARMRSTFDCSCERAAMRAEGKRGVEKNKPANALGKQCREDGCEGSTGASARREWVLRHPSLT